ncbi:MAG: cyclic nucleotide-binding domain-containing protein [Bryobacterales bacterium]|nr:cyclic nucleotide-binding domain-containing protein [Bryobacterales bacterium]
MEEIRSFLASSPVFREVEPEQLDAIAPLFQIAHFPVGTNILRQGGYSQAVYFLRSGRLAVRVERHGKSETVAYLQPPDLFGELSFITGRACVADVEVIVDADVIFLPKEAVPQLPEQRDAVLRGLMRAVAERLQNTVLKGAKATDAPVVMLQPGPGWKAPRAFAAALAESLARQSVSEACVIYLGAVTGTDWVQTGEQVWKLEIPLLAGDPEVRAQLARWITDWKRRYPNVVLCPIGPEAGGLAALGQPFTNALGILAGPGEPVAPDAPDNAFAVASGAEPTLPWLDGSHQLIWEESEAEQAVRDGAPLPRRFARTVDSIARHLLGLQFGIALGGGAAWGWAHIGVLSVLEGAGLPVDVLSGCSMGSVIGAFRSSGVTVPELEEIADYWRTRTLRFVEWRFWRMCLLNENAVRKVFRKYFDDRGLNQVEIPYWANAVDIKNGKEFTILDGTLVECVRASIALPGLLPPAERPPHLLVDAGIMDPVPVNLVRRMGAAYAVAVNAMAALEAQEVQRNYPFNAFDIMLRCTRVMGHEIGQARAEDAANIVLTPALGDVTMLQFGRVPEIIAAGRRVAEDNLATILAGYERLRQQVLAERATDLQAKI